MLTAKKMGRKNYPTLCCYFQNWLLDHQTYGNHTVTLLIFSVFGSPMITDDKKPGVQVDFIDICLLTVIL